MTSRSAAYAIRRSTAEKARDDRRCLFALGATAGLTTISPCVFYAYAPNQAEYLNPTFTHWSYPPIDRLLDRERARDFAKRIYARNTSRQCLCRVACSQARGVTSLRQFDCLRTLYCSGHLLWVGDRRGRKAEGINSISRAPGTDLEILNINYMI